jgi:endonuclease/exonuclease/phosphatase family metal-dependent hydrolase
MTWNLWWRFGPWERRRHAILDVLRRARPDVVGLQEVWEQGGDNLAGWLAEELGMHWTWVASDAPEGFQKRLGDSTVDVGNAVLSRWPVADRASLRLPVGDGRDDGRTALYALLDAPGHQVPFFTVHLNSGPHESAVRRGQVTALARFVADRGGGAGTAFPPIVTGDFNAEPDSDELRLFGGLRTAPVVPRHCLLDAWDLADPHAPSATWDLANDYGSLTFERGWRIDYIHAGLPGPGGLGAIRSAHRTGDTLVDGVQPSDHAAVVAEFAG